MWLLGFLGLSIGGGLLGLIVYLIIAAVVLLLSDRLLPRLSVSGFLGCHYRGNRHWRCYLVDILATQFTWHQFLVTHLPRDLGSLLTCQYHQERGSLRTAFHV